jgi:hypothetical protein
MIGAMFLVFLYVFVVWTETTVVLLLNDNPENASLFGTGPNPSVQQVTTLN